MHVGDYPQFCRIPLNHTKHNREVEICNVYEYVNNSYSLVFCVLSVEIFITCNKHNIFGDISLTSFNS